MSVFTELAASGPLPMGSVGAHDAHEKWQENQDQKNVWYFLSNGWLDQAVELITKPKGLGWKIFSTSEDLDSRSATRASMSLIHAWAEAPEHANDRLFLERWQQEFGDVTGEAVMKSWTSKHTPSLKNGVVRLAASHGRWNKVEALLEMGAPWADAHADVFLRACGLGFVYNQKEWLDTAKKLLKSANVKEWIDGPIRERGYGFPTALACALESDTEEAKELVPLLLDAGADVNAPLSNGNTILHRVMGQTREPYKALAKRIIRLGGDLSRPNDEGVSPIGMWLKRREHQDWTPKERAEKEREWLLSQATQKAATPKPKKQTQNAL